MQLQKRPKVKIEPDVEISQSFDVSLDHTINDSTYGTDGVIENELVKVLSQCILANVSKRGFVRDIDIGEMFSDRKERELRGDVLKKTSKLLKNILGYRLDRDEEGKRYYLSTNLCKGIEIAQEMANEAQRMHNEYNNEDDALREEMNENEHFKNCLLEMALMFIFMTKRHSGSRMEAEKGVDQVLLRSFLDDLFDSFGRTQLTAKQFGEIFGPAKSAEFIAHGWLRCSIQNDQTSGIEQISYHWGPRAETVISKKRMLEAFCEIYGTNPNNFPNHVKIAGIRGK